MFDNLWLLKGALPPPKYGVILAKLYAYIYIYIKAYKTVLERVIGHRCYEKWKGKQVWGDLGG